MLAVARCRYRFKKNKITDDSQINPKGLAEEILYRIDPTIKEGGFSEENVPIDNTSGTTIDATISRPIKSHINIAVYFKERNLMCVIVAKDNHNLFNQTISTFHVYETFDSNSTMSNPMTLPAATIALPSYDRATYSVKKYELTETSRNITR